MKNEKGESWWASNFQHWVHESQQQNLRDGHRLTLTGGRLLTQAGTGEQYDR